MHGINRIYTFYFRIRLLLVYYICFFIFQNIYANFLNFNSRHIKKLHLSPGACSFNTGVYVVDLYRWRAANITSELEHWIKLNTK